MKFLWLAAIATALIATGRAQKANPDALLTEDFENRVKDYVKWRKQVEGTLPALKPTVSPEEITHHEHELAEKIRKARRGSVQGAIFTHEIEGEFRHLIGLAMQGSDASHIHQSLQHAEPMRLRLRVNEVYPAPGIPLQSTPPTLLANLPPLPPELDYRVVSNNLVLRDAKANLVLDFIPNAIP